jgi:uncharacterized protein
MKIVGLFHFPVKSLPGISLQQSKVDALGLEGDRRWMIVDRSGTFQTFRDNPIMSQIAVSVNEAGISLSHKNFGVVQVKTPQQGSARAVVRIWKDTVHVSWVEDTADAYLSEIFQKQLRLVYLDDPKARKADPKFSRSDDYTSFADDFPIVLTTTASLNELNSHLECPVEMRRFRPNIVLETETPWVEDTWKQLRIAGGHFRITKPCARCVMTTQDPDTGIQTDPFEPLRTLSKLHRSSNGKIIFGQNVIVAETMELRLGLEVEVIEAGSSNLA